MSKTAAQNIADQMDAAADRFTARYPRDGEGILLVQKMLGTDEACNLIRGMDDSIKSSWSCWAILKRYEDMHGAVDDTSKES